MHLKKFKIIFIILLFIVITGAVAYTNRNKTTPQKHIVGQDEALIVNDISIEVESAAVCSSQKYIDHYGLSKEQVQDEFSVVLNGVLKPPYMLVYRLRVNNHSDKEADIQSILFNSHSLTWVGELSFPSYCNETTLLQPDSETSVTAVSQLNREAVTSQALEKLLSKEETIFLTTSVYPTENAILMDDLNVDASVQENRSITVPESEEKSEETELEGWLACQECEGLKIYIEEGYVTNHAARHPELKDCYFSEVPYGTDGNWTKAGEIPDCLNGGSPLPDFTEKNQIYWGFAKIKIRYDGKKKSYALTHGVWSLAGMGLVLVDEQGNYYAEDTDLSYLDNSESDGKIDDDSGILLNPGEETRAIVGFSAMMRTDETHTLSSAYIGWTPSGYADGQNVDPTKNSRFVLQEVTVEED